ncbi:MAG: hypothetical protein A2359_00840 [Candidatus Moranbacteria bacterium RIFOXYB1_FULL_43_19]|nr:MAG: hypothetical protein A2184_00240 [Candidatus Moranbacteria bacterium RIFOXYA1_FULL_44_7]OGI27360.1 MAG: hypothetical protein A2359_00840 [Candidatus Moranbacteria bacterium RIFOXYB1_FULL_43_19]OGI33864.1 MAG: hypothetical protein A2420_05480 [Candidatus Moranbacteria bacterium RIFOXYC1_FULL_44_13]OGI38810.1 MAG: hypothetical protein A2612_01140 [Candidatus Moranbacteria bacterium RIFOXYD1_FULL_44_12]
MDKTTREEIKRNLKLSLRKYVSNFVYKNIQPLDFLIPKERKIRSVVGGLETSMGTTVWEPIAKTLAEMNGFEIIEQKILKPKPFPEKLANELSKLITLRENKKTWIPTKECVKRLKSVCNQIDGSDIEFVAPAPGTGVDVRIKKRGLEYAFDIKTVQPNLGSIKAFNKEILEWYAYRLCENPAANIKCIIAYPYNPHPNDFWAYSPHNIGILECGIDAVVEKQFWDFLSGFSNTFEILMKIFKELNDEGFGKELSRRIKKIHTIKKEK